MINLRGVVVHIVDCTGRSKYTFKIRQLTSSSACGVLHLLSGVHSGCVVCGGRDPIASRRLLVTARGSAGFRFIGWPLKIPCSTRGLLT